jgi:hypothetical protein
VFSAKNDEVEVAEKAILFGKILKLEGLPACMETERRLNKFDACLWVQRARCC